MAVTKIDAGEVMGIWIAFELTGTPTWLEMVCSTDLSLAGTKDTTEVKTRCGTQKSAGIPSYSIDINGVANSTPEAGQVSIDRLAQAFRDGERFKVKIAYRDNPDPMPYYREGVGEFSDFTEDIPVEGNVGYSGTIQIDGNILTEAA